MSLSLYVYTTKLSKTQQSSLKFHYSVKNERNNAVEGKGRRWACNTNKMCNLSQHLFIMGRVIIDTIFPSQYLWCYYCFCYIYAMLLLLHAHPLPLPSYCSLFFVPCMYDHHSKKEVVGLTSACDYLSVVLHDYNLSWNSEYIIYAHAFIAWVFHSISVVQWGLCTWLRSA